MDRGKKLFFAKITFVAAVATLAGAPAMLLWRHINPASVAMVLVPASHANCCTHGFTTLNIIA